MTEQPVLYAYIAQGGGQLLTSPKKPVIKGADGRLLPPSDPLYDPAPMALKYDNDKVRFTDFTLDGASQSAYFYFIVELGNTLKISDRSAIAGPIKLVNSNPPQEVAIKKVVTRLPSPIAGIPASVVFSINPYIESENIQKFEIYRAYAPEDALTVRTMQMVKAIDAGDEIADDFSDLL